MLDFFNAFSRVIPMVIFAVVIQQVVDIKNIYILTTLILLSVIIYVLTFFILKDSLFYLIRDLLTLSFGNKNKIQKN